MLIKCIAYGFLSSSCPNTAPIVVSEASEEMWNGNSHSGPQRIGTYETSFVNSIRAMSQVSDQLNSASFESNRKSGDAILEKYSMKRQ